MVSGISTIIEVALNYLRMPISDNIGMYEYTQNKNICKPEGCHQEYTDSS